MWTIGGLSIQNSALVGALIIDFIIQWVCPSVAHPLLHMLQNQNSLQEIAHSMQHNAGGVGNIGLSADRQAL